MARFGKSLYAMVAALVVGGVSTAQVDEFRDGIKAYRLGKFEEAKEKFAEVLANDPTNEDAFELWKTTDQEVWRTLLLSEQDGIRRIAQHLLDQATLGRKERSRDEDRIAELVDEATSGDFQQRNKAALMLMSEHGEFAVPALIEKLGNADDDDAQIHGILALQRLGRDATLPLVEALKSDNEWVRRNAVAAISHVKDDRAAGAVAVLAASDPSEAVRNAAKATLAGMGMSGANAADLYLQLAKNYLDGKGVRAGERSEVVWSWGDDGLTAVNVPAAVYDFELAKKAAHAAVRLAPGDMKAKATLAQAYLAQAAAIQDSLAASPDNEALGELAGRVPALEMMASASGLDVVRSAVQSAIDDGQVPAAVAGMKLLGSMESRGSLASSPLVTALDSADSRVAYAASLALANASGGGNLPNAVKVVSNLANAVTEKSITRVKIIDRNPMTSRMVTEAAFSKDVNATVTDSGVDGVSQLLQFPNVDVVVVSENLEDTLPDGVIGVIKKDSRFTNTKILLLTDDVDGAQERYGDRIDGTIEANGLSGDSLKEAVNAAIEDLAPDALRARADAVAVDASNALHALAANAVDVSGALGNLTAQLDRDDAVAIPAAGAIGQGGQIGQVGALMQVLGNDGASLDLKVACADAAGNIFARSDALSDDMFEQLLATATGDADIKLRSAVARALGKAELGADAKLRLLEALNVSAGVDN